MWVDLVDYSVVDVSSSEGCSFRVRAFLMALYGPRMSYPKKWNSLLTVSACMPPNKCSFTCSFALSYKPFCIILARKGGIKVLLLCWFG